MGTASFAIPIASLLFLAPACSATGDPSSAETAGTAATGTGGAGSGGGGVGLTGAGGGATTTAAPAHLLGKVFAPEGSIPISGALVYFTSQTPPAIPDAVYCDKCVELEPGTPYTTTAPDGSFDLGTGTGSGYLVVQKGAFRRVRPIDVVVGVQEVPKEMTTMPPKTDKAAGDDVPKIAVALGAWDPIEVVLARMGLAATITTDGFGRARVLSKDATGFAIYGLHEWGEVSPYPGPEVLLSSPTEIEKYHMVFVPCSGSSSFDDTGPECSGVWAGGNVAATLEGFVRKGGRVYASDWAYEHVRQVFPGFLSWQGETPELGSACLSGDANEAAPPVDPDLAAWLGAQGKDLTTVMDAWTHLTGVHEVADVDAEGKPALETPKVWVHANGDPATTSFKHGCGRVLYTTYHTQPTNGTNAALEPQALALLYLVLEVGVCIEAPIPE